MNDLSIMPFGKYRGKHLKDVPSKYLLWLYSEGKLTWELKAYIEDNMDVLTSN